MIWPERARGPQEKRGCGRGGEGEALSCAYAVRDRGSNPTARPRGRPDYALARLRLGFFARAHLHEHRRGLLGHGEHDVKLRGEDGRVDSRRCGTGHQCDQVGFAKFARLDEDGHVL
eukprot:scaffold30369_cov52-Phaeocystis_antarctica.AAC.2